MTELPPAARLSRRGLIAATAGAAAVAFLILFAAILPAEYGRDPLGLGKATGLARIWAPKEIPIDPNAAGVARAREYATAWRTDVIEIPLAAATGARSAYELEYKVRMAKDATLIYQWQALGVVNASDLYYDFHGHTLVAKPGQSMTVATYKQANSEAQQGALTAPFDGIQGWFFQNSSVKPVVVRVRIAGFYDLIPAGQPGNEAGIVANVPAAQALPGAGR